jgi:hypothetical protein
MLNVQVEIFMATEPILTGLPELLTMRTAPASKVQLPVHPSKVTPEPPSHGVGKFFGAGRAVSAYPTDTSTPPAAWAGEVIPTTPIMASAAAAAAATTRITPSWASPQPDKTCLFGLM